MSRVQLTEKEFAQLTMFQSARREPQGRAHSRKPAASSRRKQDMGENQVEAQVTKFLALKGWECRRNHVGTYVPYYHAMEIAAGKPLNHARVVRIGEKSMADYTFIRRIPGQNGVFESFDLEVKAGRNLPTADQKEWMRRRNALGYVATWTNSFDSFLRWYRESYEASR